MAILFANFAYSTLAFSILSTDLALTVTAGQGVRFPSPTAGDYFYLTLEDAALNREIVKVTGRATDVLTIVRAQETTIARAFASATSATLRITAGTFTDTNLKTPLGYSAAIPTHSTAQRETGLGFFGYNSSTGQFEGYGSTGWGAIGGGASGSGTDAVGYEVDQLITQAFTVGQSAMVSGAAISIATPAVITLANSFVAGQPIRFTTTGALPTGLSTNSQYFVSATGLTTSSFQIAATAAAAIAGTGSIATSGTQSGVHSAGKCKDIIIPGGLRQATGAGFFLPTGCRAVFP